eukprot:jgi/Astpho2/5451/Aster-07990
MASSHAMMSLSLLGLTCLAGAGVGVGSGVAMMYQAMAAEEQQKASGTAAAHSPKEPKVSLATRGFAADGANKQ